MGGKQHQALRTMSQTTSSRSSYELATSYVGLAQLQHMAHLVDQSQPDDAPEPSVFRLIGHALDYLETLRRSTDPRPAEIARGDTGGGVLDPRPRERSWANVYFEMWLLHFAGLLPRPGNERNNAADGRRADDPLHPHEVIDQLDESVARAAFSQRIEDFVGLTLQLGSLTQTNRLLGRMWEMVLGKEVPTRHVLMELLQGNRIG
jgi:hypothetical protein